MQNQFIISPQTNLDEIKIVEILQTTFFIINQLNKI